MSIIHDALKKVQKNISSKAGEIPVSQPNKDPNKPTPLFADTPIEDPGPPPEIEVLRSKPPVFRIIKSILAICCALAITGGAIWYIYQQFQNDIPHAQIAVKKTIYKLIHKEMHPDLKTKRPQDLKPLAQITINPALPAAPTTTTETASPAPSAITLNIHGIMSNATGTGNLALINDEVYQEGDSVGGAKIVKINLNSITVIINGQEETIHVKG